MASTTKPKPDLTDVGELWNQRPDPGGLVCRQIADGTVQPRHRHLRPSGGRNHRLAQRGGADQIDGRGETAIVGKTGALEDGRQTG